MTSFEQPSGNFKKSPLASVAKGGFSTGRLECWNEYLNGALDLPTDKMTGLILAVYNHKEELQDDEQKTQFVRMWVEQNV